MDFPETKAAGVADGFLPNPKGRLQDQFHEVARFKHLSPDTDFEQPSNIKLERFSSTTGEHRWTQILNKREHFRRPFRTDIRFSTGPDTGVSGYFPMSFHDYLGTTVRGSGRVSWNSFRR
jgi:hypothetical protein